MGTRNSPGRVKLDDIKLEGGIIVKVHLVKETGIFHATYFRRYETERGWESENKSWEGKDLDKIRADIAKWAKEEKALKWEPVISVSSNDEWHSGGKHKVLGQEFERLMRAPKLKGEGFEWRNWAHEKPDGGWLYDSDLEVYGPSATTSEPTNFHGDNEPVVMAYTPERWLALLDLVKMEEALRDRLQEFVSAGNQKLELFLSTIPQSGLLGLVPEGVARKGKKK